MKALGRFGLFLEDTKKFLLTDTAVSLPSLLRLKRRKITALSGSMRKNMPVGSLKNSGSRRPKRRTLRQALVNMLVAKQ
jgi:hypothetical protein